MEVRAFLVAVDPDRDDRVAAHHGGEGDRQLPAIALRRPIPAAVVAPVVLRDDKMPAMRTEPVLHRLAVLEADVVLREDEVRLDPKPKPVIICENENRIFQPERFKLARRARATSDDHDWSPYVHPVEIGDEPAAGDDPTVSNSAHGSTEKP